VAKENLSVKTGNFLENISDHLRPTRLLLLNNKKQSKSSRQSFLKKNMIKFRNDLQQASWTPMKILPKLQIYHPRRTVFRLLEG